MKTCFFLFFALAVLAQASSYKKLPDAPFPSPRPDAVLIVVYRTTAGRMSFDDGTMWVDDKKAGRASKQTYMYVYISPGLHCIRAGVEGGYCNINSVAGESYYFRLGDEPLWGGIVGTRIVLESVEEKVGRKEARALVCQQLVPPPNFPIPDPDVTPLAVYNAAFYKSLERRWGELAKQSESELSRSRVVIKYTIQKNGQITNIKVVSTKGKAEKLEAISKQLLSEKQNRRKPFSAALIKQVGDSFDDKITFSFD